MGVMVPYDKIIEKVKEENAGRRRGGGGRQAQAAVLKVGPDGRVQVPEGANAAEVQPVIPVRSQQEEGEKKNGKQELKSDQKRQSFKNQVSSSINSRSECANMHEHFLLTLMFICLVHFHNFEIKLS